MRRKSICRFGSSSGMSLVELMVVMVILAVVMLAVMSLYIPAQRATVTQTQVSDVQSNLRLALRVMSRDILMAGFLMPHDPIVFPTGTNIYSENPDDPGTIDNDEFYIRTRAVGTNNFARIVTATRPALSDEITLNIADSEMITNAAGQDVFPDNSRVRLFSPVSAVEINASVGTDVQRAHRVDSSSGTQIVIDVGAQGLSEAQLSETQANLLPETVVIRIKDENQPPVQTIRYQLLNGTLLRTVNPTTAGAMTQILARNIDTSDTDCTSPNVTSCFDFQTGPDGRYNRVDILLSGITAAGKAGTLSEQKTRTIQTSVKLRNVD